MFTPLNGITAYDCALLNRNISKRDGCWIWLGSHSSGGYPCMHKGNGYGKSTTVARVVCQYKHGIPLAHLVAMHSCDNPACVNPDHISWGTQSDNIKQAYKKGNRRTIQEYIKLKDNS